MDELDPGWFNPTVLGVLLIVLAGVGYGLKEGFKILRDYFMRVAQRSEDYDKFFQEMLKSSEVAYTSQVEAWQKLTKESTLASIAMANAIDSHEKRAADRHEALTTLIAEARLEAHEDRLRLEGKQLGNS